MKLHLPTALRRALLALIALLNPSVVTTTIATATLAAITAPTMAEDLDLTLDSTYEFSGSVSFDSVTTGSSNDIIKATAMDSTFTANTVSVGTGHMLTVIGDDPLRVTDFTVKELNVAEGGFINFTDGTYVRAASGVTLYDLFKGVSSGSVQGTDFYIYGAGHSAAETEKLVKSSDLFGKLHSAAQGFINITEGNLIIDADNTSASGGGCDLYIGDEEGSTDAFATITGDVTRFDYLYVVSDGKLTIEKSSESLTLKNLWVDGSLESHRDLVLEGNCTIVGKLTLGGTIENNGTVRLELGVQRSSITVDSSSFAEEHITHTYTDGDNGYLSGVKYTVITGAGTLTGRARWYVDDMAATYEDGKVIVEYDSPDTDVYYVASGTIDYGTDVTDLETDTTKFCMKGGSLVLSKNLKDTQGIKVDVASSVSINNDVTLNATQLDASAADVTLSGSGSYTMTNGANTLGTGVSVGSDWSGTVNTTGNTTALALDTLGVSGSSVELGSNSHTLAARDQSVAANLNSTGSVSLEGKELTLSGSNTLGSLSVDTLKIAGGSTAISGGLTTTGESSVADGAHLSIGGVSSIGGKITLGSGSTLVLAGTITLDDTAFTAGTRERYSAGNNGYKITDTTYTVLTGGAVTGTATWKVGTTVAEYDNGMVILAGTEDTEVYYVRNGDVSYTQTLANDSTKFSLEGGHLVLTESLKGSQSIEWKNPGSWVNIENADVELKSSQLSTVGAGDFTLIAPDGGTYIIDKKVGDIVELTLGTGVTLLSDYWFGTVKTAGDTTVSSDLDTTSWKNTELNGTTTVNSGVTLTLGGNTTLGGKISNSGTLNLQGTITVDTTTFKPSDAVKEVTGYFIGNSTTPNTTKSGFEAACWDITIAEGGTIDGTGAIWKLKGDDDASFDFESDGTLHAYGSSVGTIFHVAQGDTITYSDSTLTHFTNSEGEAATGIQLDGGKLKLEKALGTTSDDFVKAATASEVEIGSGVTLNATQLDASAADVTLAGAGGYTMESGANTLGSGVSVGAGWSGTVNTTGDTSELALDTLGVSGSKVELGSDSHTLADRNQSVAADLNSTGSVSLTGKELTLGGNNTLGSVSVGSLVINGGSTAISHGLTTAGESSVADGASLSIDGASALGGKITLGTGSTLTLDGTIKVNKDSFAPEDAVVDRVGYFIGNATKPNTTQSGFEAACWDITIAEGGTITDNGADWQLVGDADADFSFESDGTLHAYGSGVGSVFHVAAGDSIIYGSGNEADFTNSKGTEATCISLNGGTLVLNTGLRDNREDYVKSTAASTVEIGNGVELKAAQLDASAAEVTLAGTGGYDLESGSALAGGVKLGSGWKGTVYTGAIAAGTESLDVNHLGNTDSTVQLGKNGDASMNSLTADTVGAVVTPGALSLMSQTSQVRHLTVKGGLTLGSADAAATLIATGALSTQGITLGNIGSTASAAMLLDDTLNLTVADSELLKLTGSTTVLTLGSAYAGTTTLNGEEKVLGSNGKMIYTLVWQTPLTRAATASSLVLQADTNPVYVQNKVGEQVKHYSYNGRAGLRILNAAYAEHNPQQNAAGGALAGLIDTVDAGKMTDEDLAAVAGASTTVLGQALSGDVERQLRAIRNRAAMGNHGTNSVAWNGRGGFVSTSLPSRYFAWVNAEGNRAEQNDDGTSPGYTLNSWGGTVGAGMQVNSNLTMGLALSAMYGDLRSDGPDSLDGDMDTTYLSAFARYESGKWSHAFIGTAGTMEADYKRTVSHATDSYHTYGDTDGTAFGLMYEVSRDFTLGSKGTLSPVFNISYRHAEVDGYSESGADAALNVGKQSFDTVTVGTGARYAAVVGQQTLNRACGFEARALVKYDLGDRQSTTSTGFTGYATRAGIESAELGAFGVELGAGISVPVGTGSIFADGAVELRSDYTNFNATVGYRIQF